MSQKDIGWGIPSSAYVHIPFCRRRCFYCDFPVFVVGNNSRGENSGTIGEYVEVLCQEIRIAPTYSQPLETIFFGGGTPSLLSTAQLQSILTTLEQRFGIASGVEISMEIDPGTFDFAHIAGYRSLGVNRVSLGVQAFQEELLKTAGRSHSLIDIFTAIELIHKVEIPEFSLDLISGLPYQSLAQWQDSLIQAVAATPTHISIYDLTIEPGTAFNRYYKPGDHPLPTDETTVKMYQMGQKTLTDAGYEHYEISNYAQPGHQCQHNRVYWQNRPYYGFGMGAASYIQGKRFTRPRKTQEYYQWLKNGAVIDCEVTPQADVLLETLMLGLRLAEGISLNSLATNFGNHQVERIQSCLQPYFAQGWVKIVGDRLRFSDPDGFIFSNVMLAKLFEKLGE
ncbi:radical SAM family heme chaperone HemW [Dolichospermum circinale]|jgi:putative oxygen-independent coproporphyrinogen III oxidase|uniref:radical SAM family heme chaperone HemW n=1 Tax=Dolichospermum circinale TaxID=109265 RepID=UPI0023305C10|nr:radical SAM family heme chaperone HemW [Dolichospermum circinale]MDB9448859.1 radical SAM family heme chaperone HemW [Dolichospermum circinale CS-547]